MKHRAGQLLALVVFASVSSASWGSYIFTVTADYSDGAYATVQYTVPETYVFQAGLNFIPNALLTSFSASVNDEPYGTPTFDMSALDTTYNALQILIGNTADILGTTTLGSFVVDAKANYHVIVGSDDLQPEWWSSGGYHALSLRNGFPGASASQAPSFQITTTEPVPEPSTFALLGLALLGMAAVYRKRAH